MGDSSDWRLYPRLLLRRAGFEVGLLTGLADGPTGRVLAVYRDATGVFEDARARLRAGIAAEVARTTDKTVLRGLSKLRSRVGRRVPAGEFPGDVLTHEIETYSAALDELAEADRLLAGALALEQGGRAERIRELLSREQVQDALLQLSPSFYDEVVRWLADPAHGGDRAKDRAFYRRAYLYGQRLGAKNETTSFFGPLVHGRAEETGVGITLGEEQPSGVVASEATVAFWAVCELAMLIGSAPEVRSHLPVAWMPACVREDGVIGLADGRRVRLSGWQQELVGLVDDVRSAGDLAAALERPIEDVLEVLDRLRQAGAVRLWPEPPSTTARPLDWLIDWTGRAVPDSEWPAKLAGLRELAGRYAAAEGHATRAIALEQVEKWFTELTAVDARRASGRMYADRLVVSLDAMGDQGPVLVGGDVRARWEEQLSPVLDLAARFGVLGRAAANEMCVAVLRAADVESMPYAEVIRHLQQAELDSGQVDRFKAEYAALVESRVDGLEAVLTKDDLRALSGPTGGIGFVSPDLMLEHAADGREVLVLGELHPYVFAWGSQGLFSGDQQAMLDDFAADLTPWGGAERLATVIRRRRHKGLVADWFPGRFIEITAYATDDRARTVPLTDIEVVLHDGQAKLRTADGELVLYAGEDDHVHLRAFAPPGVSLPTVRFGDFSPRVMAGDVLVQRARWWLGREDLGLAGTRDTGAVVRAVQRLRATRGIPRFCFVHVGGEPKPVGIDLDNPLAVDALVSLVMAGDSQEISMAEMRPAPDELWLRRRSGLTTSEFRIAMRRAR